MWHCAEPACCVDARVATGMWCNQPCSSKLHWQGAAPPLNWGFHGMQQAGVAGAPIQPIRIKNNLRQKGKSNTFVYHA